MQALYMSKHAIALASILSVLITTTAPIKWIRYPLSTIFYTLLIGGSVGKIIELYTPKILKAYIPGTILVLSLCNRIARYFGWLSLSKGIPFIKINMGSEMYIKDESEGKSEPVIITTNVTNPILYKLYQAFLIFIDL